MCWKTKATLHYTHSRMEWWKKCVGQAMKKKINYILYVHKINEPDFECASAYSVHTNEIIYLVHFVRYLSICCEYSHGYCCWLAEKNAGSFHPVFCDVFHLVLTW